MARTQFTFTFTNAQPGSVVSFDDGVLDHLYADATSSTRVGRPLVLNSSNALSVWSDVETLTATTEDGLGNDISATATRDNPSVTTDDGTAGQNPFSSGGSTPGGLVVRKFPFAFDTPGLATGHIVWTPADGDVLLDAWFDVETAFDGTTPLADVGTFAGANADYGFFQWTTGAIPMSTVVPIDSGLPNEFSPGINTPNVALSATTTSSVIRNVPARLQAVPLKIIVTTTGQSSGADPGATHGAATLYLVTATPA